MKSRRPFRKAPARWDWTSLLGLAATAGWLAAADTNAPPSLTPQQMFEGGASPLNNWIDFSAGAAFVSGDKAQFQQQHQLPAGAFGGISDFHFQHDVATNTTLTVDGRGIIDSHDYKLSLDLERENTGFLRLSLEQSRTWSDPGGGYFPGSGQYYQAQNNALTLDRGKFSLEGGWTPEKGPKMTFKYVHSYRDGDKASTDWGFANPTGSALAQGLSPALDDIHEHSDSFQLDVTDHVKATDVGGGFSYTTGKLDDALKVTQYPGEPVQQDLTDRQGTSYDMLNGHAFTETWVRTNVMVSTGLSYSGAGNTFSASRIYGNDFDVGYTPSAESTFGYYGLTGSSRLHDYVLDVNIFYKPSPHFSIVPSFRADREYWNSTSTGMETLGANAPVPFTSDEQRSLIDLRERLDLTYTGVTNWVFYGRGDFTEGDGNLNQSGGLVPVAGIGVPTAPADTDDRRFFQKYSLGARWYLSRRATLDVGGYYKVNRYHYDNVNDNTIINGAYPYQDYLVMQNFETYDANIRLTLRPWQNVTAVSRYEYQLSTIDTAPDAEVGLSEVQSSTMTSHIIAQDVSWIPWSRLSLQTGLNYVLSDTRTPASDVTQGILNAQNNYWTVNFSSLFVVDDKTDLNLSYLYYVSGDYVNNSPLGVPYGAGSEEHAITATWTRRMSKNIRLAVKYGYFRYADATYGGNRDFGANLISATLRYQF
jgi:hypothetical protein